MLPVVLARAPRMEALAIETLKTVRRGLRELWEVTKETAVTAAKADVSLLAAGLAFYGLLAGAPLFVIAVMVAGTIFGEGAAREEVITGIAEHVDAEAAKMLAGVIESLGEVGSGVIATIISVLVIWLSATVVFVALSGAINRVWDIPEQPYQSITVAILGILKTRLVSFVLVLAMGGLLVAWLAGDVVVALISGMVGDAEVLALPAGTWRLVELGFSFVLLTGAFTGLLRFLPSIRVPLRHLWKGAALTAACFILGRWAFSVYVTESSVRSAYGAAGSLMVLLIWAYYSALVFLVGAALARALQRRQQDKDTDKDKDEGRPPAQGGAAAPEDPDAGSVG